MIRRINRLRRLRRYKILSRLSQELGEDIYLSKLAEEAEKRAKGKSPISADRVWKALDL